MHALLYFIIIIVTTASALAHSSSKSRRYISPPPPAASSFNDNDILLTGEICELNAPTQTWTVSGTSLTLGGACLTASSWPLTDGTQLTMSPCISALNTQQFTLRTTPGETISLVSALDTTFCVNLSDYGTIPGTPVWLYTCSPTDCEGNCAWNQNASAIVNPSSGLCLNAASPPPPLPHTCALNSPSVNLPFCDSTRPVDERVADLYSRLSQAQRIQLFSIPAEPNTYDAILNLKSVYWDITCIAGLSPGRFNPTPNVTVFANTIGQAASFDINLVAAIGSATALEGRIVNQVNYRKTGGTTWQGVLCDGGPLANSAHDPRWGRISETYGEDVYLVSAMGISATRALQQRTIAVNNTGLGFLATSQVTRHFMGTHGASDMPHDAEEYTLPQWREENHLRMYEAFQRPERGDAEGIMCAISAFAEAGDIPPPRNNLTSGVRPYIPNCANNYLLVDKLRNTWHSDCFVQSDCCDSITAVVEHEWVATLSEAVGAVTSAGLVASYGNPAGITNALIAALANGDVTQATLDAAIQRTLLTLFRVGMFDTDTLSNPFRGPFDETILDGSVHRALARSTASRTMVLLENKNATLPLMSLPSKLGVIGTFSDCTVTEGDYGGKDREWPNFACSYTHSYVGSTSSVSTVRSAAIAEAAAGNATEVRWALGSGFTVPAGADGLQQAVAIASWADTVVLSVGLGTLIEAEGRDRTSLRLPDAQIALIEAVSTAMRPGSKLIVTIASAGGVDVDVPRADAILQIFYAGEETGSAVWDILLGRVVPSARLPLTIFTEEYLNIIGPAINFNMITLGVGRTYRFFNETAARAQNSSVSAFTRGRFGYGLSYCTFIYSNLIITLMNDDSVAVSVDVAVASITPLEMKGVTCTEITQLYLTLPPNNFTIPIYSLVGFTATPLLSSSTSPTQVVFNVTRDDLLTTDTDGLRELTGGIYTFSVSGHLPDDSDGAKSSNVLVGTVTI